MAFRMPRYIGFHYRKEIDDHNAYLRNKDYASAWNALERGHILGQAYPLEHTYSHWLMLKFGLKIKNFMEVLGQIPGLLAGGVKSCVGVIPVGNTGGANVPPIRPMEFAPDLKQILNNKTNSTNVQS
ncbi:MAG: DUF3703 domain-containing protein [Christiangramia sp.]|nr:DUF3703 domain-containing protein [Christiangramia sp.]